jgi:Ca2+-binding EF-hand superfamily protein
MSIVSESQSNAIRVLKRHSAMAEVFKIFDKKREGKIPTDQILPLMHSLGRECDDEELRYIISTYDRSKSGWLTYENFISYMDSTYTIPEETVKEVIESFRIFDVNGNGFMNYEEFRHILMDFGGNFKEKEVRKIFDFTDTDSDGVISYAEFVHLWKYQ